LAAAPLDPYVASQLETHPESLHSLTQLSTAPHEASFAQASSSRQQLVRMHASQLGSA
jgi:hypothetical protein